MKLPKYIMLFVAFMTSIVCYAHKVLFNTLPFLEELPTNSIFTLYQDNTGYIWIGTGDGLARYDGYSATWLSNNFSYPNRLQNNDTRCFTEDDRYIWASSTSGITLIDKTNLSTHILNSDEIRGDINDLLNDGKGTVWIATENGVYCYDLNQKFKQKYTLSQGVKSLFKDNNGYMWATGNIGLVAKYDSKSDKFIEMPSLGDEIIARMAQTSDGLYWLSTWGDGIWTFNPNASNRDAIYRHVKVMNPIRGAEEKVFFDIVQDDTFGYIWALSHFKLYIFKPDGKGGLTEINSDEISQVKGNIDLYKSYSKIMKDRMGNLWLAAFDSGYTVHFPDQRIDNHIFSDMNSALGLDPNVLYLNKDSNGIIWFDQARYGICLYDETTGRNSYSNARDNNFYNIDVGLFCPSHTPGIMWLGGRERSDNKVWKASAENMHVKLLEEYDLSSSQSGNTYLMGIIEDSEGNLYVATTRYVACLNNGEGKFKKYVDGFEDILSMDNACSNQLCVTCKSSINIVNTESQKVVKKISLDDILSSDELITNSCVMCDSLVWLSTGLGRILCANIQNENITDHTSKLDSPKGRILNLVSDGDSILYAITNKSIISLNIHNPSNNYIYSVYDDDINLTSFRYGGAFVDNDKSLYVGGHKGFIRIFSDNPRHAQATDKNLYITDIVADGKSLFFDLDAESNDNSFTEVKIEPSQKNIEIHFSNFIHGSNINVKYAYKMEGVDDDWITLSNGTNVAYYNNLPNGKHTFKVKSTDENQRFSDFTRTIIIDKIPYWYESTLAYVFYALIIIGMIALGLWLYIKHIRAEARTTMQKELTQTKINYFTSISHELLTPLSVISYASEAITKKSGDTAEQASLISRNATRLKKLIKQVLEFWKMESGKLSVRMVKTDISQHLQHVISYYFIPLAQKKDIKLEYKIESDIIGTVDIDKVEMIVMNLLSNAIKYTPSGKIISVNAFTEVVDSKSTMKLTVTDQGIGIESNELSKIFTKYYSNPKLGSYESNGIGLALAKQMAVIHGGTIEVESEIGKGSVFTLTLPLDNNSETEVESFGDSISASQEASIDKNRKQENTNEDDSKPVILFIDDNDELLSLANDLFSDTYTVITSISGNKGLEILHDKNIDIIVCDLMMPDIDGIKLCAAVREDPTTCHIPIIILTARHGPDAQIESYKIGADGFLTKPIETGVLRARIDNLIKARQQREEIFSAETTINVDTLQLKSIDEDFLDHAIKCVEDNLSDADFDIAKLSDAMCMSRSTLSRKIKAVTGKTPLEFVSNIKLKYACSMLRRGDSISAVAYATGFSSPKYFSKCFKEEFSISPSEFQHKSSDK